MLEIFACLGITESDCFHDESQFQQSMQTEEQFANKHFTDTSGFRSPK